MRLIVIVLRGSEMKKKERLMAKAMMTAAPLAGKVSLLLFVVFLFDGPFHFAKMEFSEPTALAWDGMLSMLFFVQHSGMIRRSFRRRWSNFFASPYHNSIFTLVSSAVLTAIMLLWQPSGSVLYALQGGGAWMAKGIFLMAMAGMVWGVYALKPFDPYGRRAIVDHLSGKPPRSPQFSVNGPYLWVRHPLYFFVLLLIWACPELTVDRLIFNILWTFWIYLGTVLEEKDLVADFGEVYRQYQGSVPMLIPWKGRVLYVKRRAEFG